MRTYIYIQWNLSNPDTLGTETSVLIREVSLFQGYGIVVNHTKMAFGQEKASFIIIEVVLISGSPD